MSVWEAKSPICLDVNTDWEHAWERGEVNLIGVSGDGGIAVTESGLEISSSAGVSYESDTHFYVGTMDVPIFAALTEGGNLVDLRGALPLLDDQEIEVAMRAVALARYHKDHQFCPRCGAGTHVEDLGRSRRCDACGEELFPRTDPAVIVAVIDEQDRILLGNHRGWDTQRFSILAGFVEAGESLEQTVIREVMEEVGIEVSTIEYAGSQPWPLPRSLMIGFTATASHRVPRPDSTEIRAARWFSREDLRTALDQADITLPLRASIAYRLITRWYGQPLPV